jgi:Lhr-like helicase
MNALIASKKYPGRLPKLLVDLEESSLSQYITNDAAYFYKDTPKPQQVQAVSSLVQGNNVFVQAGTGFGKTRILEMFFNLFKTNIIVLALNPLDSLGNDQVAIIILSESRQNQEIATN